MHEFKPFGPSLFGAVLLACALGACATSTSQSEAGRGSEDSGRPGRPEPASDLGLGDDDVASGTDAVDGDIVGDADTRDAPDNDLGERDIVEDIADAFVDANEDAVVADVSTMDSGADVSAPGDATSDAVEDVSTDVVADAGVTDTSVTDTGVAVCSSGSSRPCYGGPAAVAGVGACVTGVERCVAGAWGVCEGWVAPVVETCDDARDNDCDGDVDEGCAAACAAPTRVISNIDNGSVHDLFVARGLSLQEPFSINATHFSGNDVVLVDALYASSAVTPAVVNAFVDRGGTAVFFTTSLSTSCNRINNDNLNGTGLGLGCASSATGPVSRLLAHPLTEGLSTGQFPSSFAASVTGGTPVAQVGSLTIAAVLERGCGRLLVVGNGDLADGSYWPTTSGFWSNAVEWLVDRR